MIKYAIRIKELLLYTNLLSIFKPFEIFFHFVYYFNRLTKFIQQHKNGLLMNDFYVGKRDYSKRYKMYETVSLAYNKNAEPLIYIEFGVASALSFNWWLNHNKNEKSKFFGFDTFEGLPENWGSFYVKGDLAHGVPNINDSRATFIKGLFQDTLPQFLQANKSEMYQPKIIHLDADLYTATLFVLTQLYPFLQSGDLIFFDEFSVATHEFKAFEEFTKAFYVKLKPVAAVNNFYQTAFVVE